MKFVVLILLGVAVLLAVAAVVWTAWEKRRDARSAPPPLDLSSDAYSKALHQWEHDYAKGTDLRPDFPRFTEWELEQQWAYYDKHGTWPGEDRS